MDNDRIIGKAKETIGKAQAAVGEAGDDPETEARGRGRQAAGAAQDLYGQAQDLYGQAKDTFADNFSDVSESADKALHSLEREVKARPLLALLIAALVGYVLAQLTMR